MVFLAYAIYLTACGLPATEIWTIPQSSSPLGLNKGEGHYETIRGLQCLLFGWIGVFSFLQFPADWNYSSGFGWAAWLANPLALVGAFLLIFRRPTVAVLFCAVSFVFGMLYVIDPPSVNGHPDLPHLVLFFGCVAFLH